MHASFECCQNLLDVVRMYGRGRFRELVILIALKFRSTPQHPIRGYQAHKSNVSSALVTGEHCVVTLTICAAPQRVEHVFSDTSISFSRNAVGAYIA